MQNNVFLKINYPKLKNVVNEVIKRKLNMCKTS